MKNFICLLRHQWLYNPDGRYCARCRRVDTLWNGQYHITAWIKHVLSEGEE